MATEEKDYVIGIDMGGTNTEFAIVSARGDIVARDSIPTRGHATVRDYVDRLYETLMPYVDRLGLAGKLRGIGAGVPCANRATGCIEDATNMPWPLPIPLARMLSEKFGIPASITNDANAATIGEMIYGNAKGMRDFVMITLGTGLGSGFVSNGEMIYGHDGFAGEFGHIIVERNGRECGCGRRGCLETYVSATGIKRTAFELMATMTAPSKLRDIAFADFDASMISAAAEQGDPVALEAFRYTGELLGRALADVVTVTSPEAIFLFGGLSKAGKLIFEPTQWYMEENMLFVFKNKVKLLPSGIQGKNAAILGASALIWQQENK